LRVLTDGDSEKSIVKPNWYLFAKPNTDASTHGSPWSLVEDELRDLGHDIKRVATTAEHATVRCGSQNHPNKWAFFVALAAP
jgi:hypothetical protein